MAGFHNDEKRVYTFHNKSHRWLSCIKRKPNNGVEFEFNITLKNKEEDPEGKGEVAVEDFFSNLDELWGNILSELLRMHPVFAREDIENAIKDKIYVFAPALVGSLWYELMILIDLKAEGAEKLTSILCFEHNRIISSEMIG